MKKTWIFAWVVLLCGIIGLVGCETGGDEADSSSAQDNSPIQQSSPNQADSDLMYLPVGPEEEFIYSAYAVNEEGVHTKTTSRQCGGNP